MCINSERHFIFVEIVYGVEVFEEETSNEINIRRVCLIDIGFVNDEEAGVFASFLQVLLRIKLKDVITELEGDWLELLDDICARVQHMTECMLWFALYVWYVFLPFRLHLFENWWRHRQLRATCINKCRIALMGEVGEVLSVIQHTLTQERPRFEITDIILKDLETVVAIDDLG